ncbi:MAG TPA: hypothetical protein VK918_07170 [Pyrinomonadaceae bacterium]|nr:hypothetical protein [Pyrinomonadaceae bacterium]
MAQQTAPTPSPTPTPPPPPVFNEKNSQNFTVEQIVESSIFIYGLGGGRAVLDQIRKTTAERGKLTVRNAAGQERSATYQWWVMRGENSYKDRVHFEQVFPGTEYSIVRADDRVFGITNNTTFSPSSDALKQFENQTLRGLDALLRYKENESTIELSERQKVLGVDFYVVDVTDKEGRKTRFFISAKSLRVMIAEYEEDGVKYTRRFYDYRNAQGTLVPYRTVLWADGVQIEERTIGTITFGQKVEEGLFASR